MLFSLVCKQWFSVVQPFLYSSVYLGNSAKLLAFYSSSKKPIATAGVTWTKSLCYQESSLKNLAPLFRCPFTRLQDLSIDNAVITKVMTGFMEIAKAVKSLSLRGLSFGGSFPAERFSSLFHNVTELRLHGFLCQNNIYDILTPLGPRLKVFCGYKIFVPTFSDLLPMVPNVETLHLSVSCPFAWKELDPSDLPTSLTEVYLECWHTDFVMRFVASLKDPDYLPKLKVFPRITWRPRRTADQVFLRTSAFNKLQSETRHSLLKHRGLTCSPASAEGTVFGTDEIALEAYERYMEELEEEYMPVQPFTDTEW